MGWQAADSQVKRTTHAATAAFSNTQERGRRRARGAQYGFRYQGFPPIKPCCLRRCSSIALAGSEAGPRLRRGRGGARGTSVAQRPGLTLAPAVERQPSSLSRQAAA